MLYLFPRRPFLRVVPAAALVAFGALAGVASAASPVQNAPAAPVSAAAVSGPATLTLDLSRPGVAVSPMLYGLMTEEINYSYDGGLYAELLRNRTFKDDPTVPAHWAAVPGASGGGSGDTSAITLDTSQPINDALPVCLRLTAVRAGAGITNDGYWGIPVRPRTTYQASFFAKADSGGGPLMVSIQSADSATTYATATVPRVTNGWQKYTVSLTTSANVPTTAATRFVVSVAKPGNYWFNVVSLFPPTFHNRPNGNRPDIMQLLTDMKPKFLRLPGGNYLEGDTIDTRFPWKKTLGPIENRPGHMGTWKYRSSDGMGLLEYLQWCEDLKIEPLLAVYAGYSLRGDHVEPGTALQPFVDEALDEIEYVTGDAKTTKWGAQRAKDGHAAPFPLHFVEIGNEDGFDKSMTYDGRYTQFANAITAKYPALRMISTVGGQDGLGRRQKVTSRPLDVVDEHYYLSAGQSESDAHRYDRYSRSGPKVFVGEWATREGAPTTNLNAALGDAAWMTGMERNSDIVLMASYAPLFVNVNPGGMQWRSDLIGYDALTSYGSPSYYAQKMFSTYLGDTVVPTTETDIPTQTWQPPTPRGREAPPARQIPALFAVATRAAKTGTVFLKVVNAGSIPQTVNINLNGAARVSPDGTAIVLSSAKPDDTNSITEPTKIVPVSSPVHGLGNQFTRTFAPYSVNVLQIETRGSVDTRAVQPSPPVPLSPEPLVPRWGEGVPETVALREGERLSPLSPIPAPLLPSEVRAARGRGGRGERAEPQTAPAAAPDTGGSATAGKSQIAEGGNETRGYDMAPETRQEVVQAAVASLPVKLPPGPVKPTWESVQANYHVPGWFEDAKFGIFMHWGLYAVPAYHNEWYEKHMYNSLIGWHTENFGSPEKFGYKDFIPLFTAAKWDPDAWADLFQKAGARYVIPTAQHHDNFALWDSAVTPFNAKQMGPKRDLIGDLAKAVRKRGLKFGVSNHGIENFQFIEPNPNGAAKAILADLKAKQADLYDPKWVDFYHVADRSDEGTRRFLVDWARRNAELIDKYQPDILWFDNGVDIRYLDPLKLWVAAYYYNRAAGWGKEVSLSTKKAAYAPSGTNTKTIGSIIDFEKIGGRSPAAIRTGAWQVDQPIGSTWGYTRDMTVSSPDRIVNALVDTVSKNGNLLLNISPMADGTIPQAQQNTLLAVGDWLRVNGEAIYGTHAWTTFGETAPRGSGGQNVRFTVKGNTLYAIVLGNWPGSGEAFVVTIKSLATGGAASGGKIATVSLVGSPGKNSLPFTQDADGLQITLPAAPPAFSKYGYVLKITGLAMNPSPRTVSGNPQ